MTEKTTTLPMFEGEELVAYANALLEEAGNKFRASGIREIGDRFVSFDGVSPRGKPSVLVAVMGAPKPGVIFFRSVLKVVDPSMPSDWLVNGQSGRNTAELVHLGESGAMLATSQERLRAYYEETYSGLANDRPEDAARIVAERMSWAADDGHVGEVVDVIRWQDRWERTPVVESEPGPSPAP